MTRDIASLKRQMLLMMLVSTALTFVAVGFAVAHFVYGVKWALWGFVGFLAVGFAVQMWFIRGVARTNKGN
jgi:multidrug transporter EmrE-like cation transporter